jgi:hypothetical protein
LRYGRPAHWLVFRQLTHSLGALTQSLEYVPARWICQRNKHMCVSHGLQ